MQRSSNDFSITTGRDGSRTFGDHDDRWVPRGRGNNRRTYNNQYGRESSRHRGHGRGSYHHYSTSSDNGSSVVDREGDATMGGNADQGARRYNPYDARSVSRHGERNNQYSNVNRSSHYQDGSTARRLGLPVHGGSGRAWYKVTIPLGKKVDKNTLMTLVGSHAPTNFRPIQFDYQGESAVFFLDDRDVAEILKSHSQSLILPNSSIKLVMTVQPSSPPSTVMNEENKTKLTTVMSARYDPSVKVLDLTALHDDQSLQQEGLFVHMNKHVMTTTVADIIEKNIPELVGLNLSKNRLLSLSSVQEMTNKAPNVTSLNLGHNQLNRIEELDKIKCWKLVELILDGNPLCDKFSSKTDYISAVRKRFPKVIKLDGTDLPPPITFDMSPSVLPPSRGSYFVNSEVQARVVRFLIDYYTLYDSDNRQPLLGAYHENALFSLCMSSNPSVEHKQPILADYITESRNSIRMKGFERSRGVSVFAASKMDKMLKKGLQQVISSLCSLPKTTHDANSFVVDVNFVSNTILIFVVNGLFKESDNRADNPPIRAFSRCFIAELANDRVLISNDTLTITNATSEQQQAAFKSTGPTPSSSPVSSNPQTLTSPVPSTSGATSPVGAALSPQQQLESLPLERQKMVKAFSQQSYMNSFFSFMCLDDNAWDYEKSIQIFRNLNAKRMIPQEAFVE